MNSKTLVKLSNIIGTISIIFLVYWVFIYISVEALDFKVFTKNTRDIFYFSLTGIIALMFGTLAINIMLNLTRIAEKQPSEHLETSSLSRKIGLIFGLSFPVIFGLLYVGNLRVEDQKKQMLIQSAKSILDKDPQKSRMLADYSFNEKWVIETSNTLGVYSKIDKHFPNIYVIVADSIDHSPMFLKFGEYRGNLQDTLFASKQDYIRATSLEERAYLNKVFFQNEESVRFCTSEGQHELFYPYFQNNKKIVLYLSDTQRYGYKGSY